MDTTKLCNELIEHLKTISIKCKVCNRNKGGLHNFFNNLDSKLKEELLKSKVVCRKEIKCEVKAKKPKNRVCYICQIKFVSSEINNNARFEQHKVEHKARHRILTYKCNHSSYEFETK